MDHGSVHYCIGNDEACLTRSIKDFPSAFVVFHFTTTVDKSGVKNLLKLVNDDFCDPDFIRENSIGGHCLNDFEGFVEISSGDTRLNDGGEYSEI